MMLSTLSNKTKYTTTRGILSLREKISSLYDNYTPKEVLVTSGAQQALSVTLKTLLNKGDEVIVIKPAYPGYGPLIKVLGYKVSYQTIDNINVTQITKAIIINSPSNPAGIVYSLTKALIESDIYIISDECYSSYNYSHKKLPSSNESIKERLIVINSFSKSHFMTGLRIGYILSTDKIINQLTKTLQYFMSCTPTISQHAAFRALDCNNTRRYKYYEKNLKLVTNFLDKNNISYIKPDGGIYIFIKTKGDSYKLCLDLLDKKQVVLIPGESFQSSGYVRLSFAVKRRTLRKGLNRIKSFLLP